MPVAGSTSRSSGTRCRRSTRPTVAGLSCSRCAWRTGRAARRCAAPAPAARRPPAADGAARPLSADNEALRRAAEHEAKDAEAVTELERREQERADAEAELQRSPGVKGRTWPPTCSHSTTPTQAYWSYNLVTEVRQGDVVLHWHKSLILGLGFGERVDI